MKNHTEQCRVPYTGVCTCSVTPEEAWDACAAAASLRIRGGHGLREKLKAMNPYRPSNKEKK